MNWPTNILRIWPTFRCTRDCGYCANWQHGKYDKREEVDSDVWVDFFERAQGVGRLVISGGEPALHPGFTRIVHTGAARGWEVGVYSNCSAQMAAFATDLPVASSLYFDFSFHWADGYGEDVEDYAARFNQVKAAGHKRLTVYTIVDPINIFKAYDNAIRFYNLTGVRMGFKPRDGYVKLPVGSLWCSDHAREEQVHCTGQRGKCYRGEALVDPEGNVYRCHYYMYMREAQGIIGNIQNKKDIKLTEATCPIINGCNTCDVGMRRIDGQVEGLDG